jgi:hypothetical protein
MIISFIHGLRISELSDVPTDGCTFAPEFGVKPYCEMHDRLLQHFVHRIGLNYRQLEYIVGAGLIGLEMTRSDCDRVFRDGLNHKIHTTSLVKKPFYWLVKWIYYYAVVLRSRIFM